MALDIEMARKALKEFTKDSCDVEAYSIIADFINDVERLMKHNSIRRIPAILRPYDEGD